MNCRASLGQGPRLSRIPPAVCQWVRRSAAFALVMLSAVANPSADTTVFGPQSFNGTDRPVLSPQTFSVAAGGDGYTLRVTNRGVIGALIVLNGRIVER